MMEILVMYEGRRSASRLNRDCMRGGFKSKASFRGALLREPGIHSHRGCYGFRVCASGRLLPTKGASTMRHCASGMTMFFLSAAPTQKPAAQFCGRVLVEAIHFEQNTMFDRTSQTKFEVFFHRRKKRASIG
jgi:hypothetical protein